MKRFIDYWVIVDTGSTDQTGKIILECLGDVPGELYRQDWFDFSTNRNGALSVAKNKSDYALFIDADERFVCPPSFQMPLLTKDLYQVEVRVLDTSFYRPGIVNNRLDWEWAGVLHETLFSPVEGRVGDIFKGAHIFADQDGNRRKDPKKHLKDAALLEAAVKSNPKSERYVFFLAQTYYQAGEYEKALKYYEKRAAMGSYDQEVYFSHYMIAKMQEFLNWEPSVFIESYYRAHRVRPTRAEPLYWVAFYYLKWGKLDLAYELLKKAMAIPLPNDSLNVEKIIYDYGLHCLLIECLSRMGRREEAREIYQWVHAHPGLSEAKRELVVKNLSKYVDY